MGSHVVDKLLGLGLDVVGLDDLSGGFVENVNPKSTFIRGSIYDVELVERVFGEQRFHYVFHLAAYEAQNLSHFFRRYNYTNNSIAMINLINAAVTHDVKIFVF